MKGQWVGVAVLLLFLASCGAWTMADDAKKEADNAAIASRVDEMVGNLTKRMDKLESENAELRERLHLQ